LRELEKENPLMKLALLVSLFFAGTAAQAAALTYNLKCNITDRVSTVELSSDPRADVTCMMTKKSGSATYAEVSVGQPVDVNVAGTMYKIQGPINVISAFSNCKDALADVERMVSARLVDADTGAIYTLDLSNQDSIRISTLKSECTGRRL
jgi:hypothetical protein